MNFGEICFELIFRPSKFLIYLKDTSYPETPFYLIYLVSLIRFPKIISFNSNDHFADKIVIISFFFDVIIVIFHIFYVFDTLHNSAKPSGFSGLFGQKLPHFR